MKKVIIILIILVIIFVSAILIYDYFKKDYHKDSDKNDSELIVKEDAYDENNTISKKGMLEKQKHLNKYDKNNKDELKDIENVCSINTNGDTIEERFTLKNGWERIQVSNNSFANYLRNLPLKEHGSKVLYYNGKIKYNDVYEAVVNMDIGNRDLQQCADAVMRLRAEYLYKMNKYEDIHFNFTCGFNAEYSKWIEGYRIAVNGNDAWWIKKTGKSVDYKSFRHYLDWVFSYAGTLSLSQELKQKPLESMEIGDVLIQGGTPGHCVIVVDMAIDKSTGKKYFMIAQSYMPAQDIHILKNVENKDLIVWYPLEFEGNLKTPEWTFSRDDLKCFE